MRQSLVRSGTETLTRLEGVGYFFLAGIVMAAFMGCTVLAIMDSGEPDWSWWKEHLKDRRL